MVPKLQLPKKAMLYKPSQKLSENKLHVLIYYSLQVPSLKPLQLSCLPLNSFPLLASRKCLGFSTVHVMSLMC